MKKSGHQASEPVERQYLVGSEILTWTEVAGHDLAWVAAWTRRDIVSQGATESAAVDALIQAIAHTWILDEMFGGKCPKPSADLLEQWREKHDRAHSVTAIAALARWQP